jgi:hypothetical protein
VIRRGVVGNPLRYKRHAKLNITPAVWRASGREGSDGMDVARKLRVRSKSKAPTSRSTPYGQSDHFSATDRGLSM